MTDRFDWRIAVIIPCFRVKKHILGVLESIGPAVHLIYVIDDQCPEKTGDFVLENCKDPRVSVRFNALNLGVGGAVMAGYKAALADHAHIAIKIDGDGQMDPHLIDRFVKPIIAGRADYTKGNRFYELEQIHRMPVLRVIGNAGLSFVTKLSSGYWDIFDPSNGYTAISVPVLKKLPLFNKLTRTYIGKLTDNTKELKVTKDCVIYKEGDSADKVFIVKEGEFVVSKKIIVTNQ